MTTTYLILSFGSETGKSSHSADKMFSVSSVGNKDPVLVEIRTALRMLAERYSIVESELKSLN